MTVPIRSSLPLPISYQTITTSSAICREKRSKVVCDMSVMLNNPPILRYPTPITIFCLMFSEEKHVFRRKQEKNLSPPEVESGTSSFGQFDSLQVKRYDH